MMKDFFYKRLSGLLIIDESLVPGGLSNFTYSDSFGAGNLPMKPDWLVSFVFARISILSQPATVEGQFFFGFDAEKNIDRWLIEWDDEPPYFGSSNTPNFAGRYDFISFGGEDFDGPFGYSKEPGYWNRIPPIPIPPSAALLVGAVLALGAVRSRRALSALGGSSSLSLQ